MEQDKLNVPQKKAEEGVSRRSVIKSMSVAAVAAVVGPDALQAQRLRQKEAAAVIASSRLLERSEYGMPRGFAPLKVAITFNDARGEVADAGTLFLMENTQLAKAAFISNTQHPELFKDGIDFDAVTQRFTSEGKHVAMIAAAAYYAPGTHRIEGVALEQGIIVGEDAIKRTLNGLLVIRNGNPEIYFRPHITDINRFFKELATEGADAFQQTAFIRPRGTFKSSQSILWELRFFVEVEHNGVMKKGVVNFTQPMTYTEAVGALKKMTGATVTKAIGLDAGTMSEAYFYDDTGKSHQMLEKSAQRSTSDLDQVLLARRRAYTNVLVLYSLPQ